MFFGVNLRLMLATVALVAALAFGAGCGDDDGDGGTTAVDSTEFTDKANALCQSAEERAVEIDPPGNPAQTAKYASGMHEVLVNLRDGLGDLQPPADLESPYKSYLSSLEDDTSTMEALGAAAESGDQARIQQLFRTRVNEESGQIAVDDLGLESCAAAANAIAKTP